jgi:chemotaxis protein CheX
MFIVLVNPNRIIEGLIRNTFQRTTHEVKGIAIDQIKHYLTSEMMDVEVDDDSAMSEKQTISEIDSLLSHDLTKTKSTGKKHLERQLRPPIIIPDFVIFHMPDEPAKAKESASLLRRSLGFRDVPILVVTETAKLIIARELISLGVDEILTLPVSPEDLLVKVERMSRPVGNRLPVITKLINPYVSSVLDLMTTMAGMHVERKDLFLKKNYRLFGDISGIMNFSGRIEGSVTVSFTEELAKEVVAKIMGISSSDITDDDLRDGVGELINIISGNAKAALSETEFSHEIALPAVIRGMGHEIRHPDGAPCMVVLFEAEGKPFAVLVSMSVKK